MTQKEKKIFKGMKNFYTTKLEKTTKEIVEFERVKNKYFQAGNYAEAQAQNTFIQRFLGIKGVCEEILEDLGKLNA